MKTVVADVIARTLHGAGVEYAFGLPGGGMIPLIEGLRRVGIRFVLTRHEAAAAFMADGYARVARRPGVCMSTLGPGAANLVSGVAHAYLDRSPLLALTAQVPDSVYPIHSHQRLDLQALFRPITKLSTTLHPANAAQVLADALRIAQTPPCGPVHVQVSEDVGPALASSPPAPPRPVPEAGRDSRIPEAMALLEKARYPVIVAGLGLEPEGPYQELRDLAERVGAPVILTPKAKGAFPADHPLYAGVIGLVGREAPFDLLQQSDLVVAVGLDVVELVAPWSVKAPLLFISQAANTDPTLPAVQDVQGSIEGALRELARGSYQSSRWDLEEIARTRPAWPQARSASLVPTAILQALWNLLPKDAIVTCDVGAHKLLICKHWPAVTPNSFLVSNGLSIMGYSFPAAIGAKLARPERTVVCLVGDGGFAMTMAELETAARLGLSLLVVVLVDQALSLIKLKQEAAGYPPVGTQFGKVDFARLAQSCGAHGIEVDDLLSFTEAVRSALATRDARAPVVIAARIDTSEYVQF